MTEVWVGDRRAELMTARRAWLDEHEVAGRERELYWAGWQALDDERLSHVRHQVDKARERR